MQCACTLPNLPTVLVSEALFDISTNLRDELSFLRWLHFNSPRITRIIIIRVCLFSEFFKNVSVCLSSCVDDHIRCFCCAPHLLSSTFRGFRLHTELLFWRCILFLFFKYSLGLLRTVGFLILFWDPQRSYRVTKLFPLFRCSGFSFAASIVQLWSYIPLHFSLEKILNSVLFLCCSNSCLHGHK